MAAEANTDTAGASAPLKTPLHARQAIMAMAAGKHVEVEIPVADTWAEAQAVMAKQRETGLV